MAVPAMQAMQAIQWIREMGFMQSPWGNSRFIIRKEARARFLSVRLYVALRNAASLLP
jgi:hypothetical protein